MLAYHPLVIFIISIVLATELFHLPLIRGFFGFVCLFAAEYMNSNNSKMLEKAVFLRFLPIKAVILNLWVTNPLEFKHPFTGVTERYRKTQKHMFIF